MTKILTVSRKSHHPIETLLDLGSSLQYADYAGFHNKQ